jgi:hypothetical protein
LPVADNLLARDFDPPGPNAAWSADITYIPTADGWLYLAVVEDMFSRMIVGWAMDEAMTSRLVVGALEMAVRRRLPGAGLVAHSDRGSQYASEHYRGLLARYGITCSMSRVAQCWDNAPVESFFASLKRELVHDERYTTRDEARASIFEYVEAFYNRARLHSSWGTCPRPSTSGRTTRNALNSDSIFRGEDQGPSLMAKPSTMSMLSNSACLWATCGRYQPGGGGGRRTRRLPSRAPRRRRTRPMVRIEGSDSVPRRRRASKIASAPWWPRSLCALSCCRRSKIRSSM